MLVFAMQSLGQIDFEELDAALQSAGAIQPPIPQGPAGMHAARIPSPVGGGWRHLRNWPRPGRGLTRGCACWSWNYQIGLSVALSDRQPNLPIALDDPVEGGHATLPLAILRALVDARRRLGTEVRPAFWIPQIRPASGITMCCDNFV